MRALEALGAGVSATLDDAAAQRSRAVAIARQRFLHHALRPAHTRTPWTRWALSMVLAVAALVFVSRRTLWPTPLTFSVDGQPAALQTWLAAPRQRTMVVDFSDGTNLRVEAASRVRVLHVDADGANITLETGVIHADVVHRNNASWQLGAGPFTVRVIGTRFDLRWDASAERFSIAVQQGTVGVAGSIVGAERPVHAGETLSVWVTEGRLDWHDPSQASNDAAESVGSEPPSGPAEPSDGAGTVAPSMATGTVAPSMATGTVAPSMATADPGRDRAAPRSAHASRMASGADWRTLAREGDLRRAFAAAETSGFPAACEIASPAELLALGDGARLAGRADRANEALSALRRDHPRDPRRPAAAFALGKVAFDQLRAYRDAAHWFALCAREQPGGPLARESAGRRIEALQRAGDQREAEDAARDYLARYPNGPHAALAAQVAAGHSPPR